MNESDFTTRKSPVVGWLMVILSLCTFVRLEAAVAWREVQFGGFFSQGYLVNSGENDYFGETSKGTFNFREYAVNASYAVGQFRVGAQAFAQRLGDYGHDRISLDWAIVDYQPAQAFGVRAGRVKMPRGLYNEALDLDSVRPFVLLPQSVYDARLRGFNAAFNGGMVYGNVSLPNAGSLDYKVFYGDIPVSTDSGANDYFNNDVPYRNTRIGMNSVLGGSMFWNTPVSGLKAGYSYSAFKNFGADRIVYMDIPEIGHVEFIMYRMTKLYARHLLSVEYSTGDWVFAAEAGREKADFGVGLPGGEPLATLVVKNTYGYVSAARRVNRWLELGAYFSYSKDTQLEVGGGDLNRTFPDLVQKDYALSARFDVSEHVILKIEGHYLDGSGKLFSTPARPQPVEFRDNAWMLVAAKMTISF